MGLPANAPRFLFEVIGWNAELRVTAFEGTEGISQCFRFTVTLGSENDTLPFERLINKSAVLTFLGAQGIDQQSARSSGHGSSGRGSSGRGSSGNGSSVTRVIHGEIVEFQQVETKNRFTLYQAVIEPKYSLLQFRTESRIYQHQSAPNIIRNVLEEAGFEDTDYRFELSQSYSEREYCVQYQESDRDFCSRLMEEEGLHYHFEHQLDRHVMVIADSHRVFNTIEGDANITYCQKNGLLSRSGNSRLDNSRLDKSTEEAIQQFSVNRKIKSGKLSLQDYNFEKPQLALLSSRGHGDRNDLECYHYPGRHQTPEEGKRLAAISLQAEQCQEQTGRLRSNSQRLVPASLFHLTNHPTKQCNGSYLVTHVEHHATQPQSLEEEAGHGANVYYNHAKCIDKNTTYKTQQRHFKKSINSCQTAIVTGPKGETVYTDKLGRIKVQFHWDRQGKRDQDASCWIRVRQSIAGSQWGTMVIPRVGHEVIVDFVDGDPDRPLVAGQLYNGMSKTPYDLPAHKTRSTYKSQSAVNDQSAESGGGFNELRIEDKKGSEQVFVHGQRDLDVYIKNDMYQTIGNDHHVVIEKTRFEHIKADSHLSVGANQNTKIAKQLSIQVDKDAHLKAGASLLAQTGKEVHLNGGLKLVLEAGVEVTFKAGGSFVKLDPSGVTVKGPMVRINSGGSAGSAQSARPTAPASAMALSKRNAKAADTNNLSALNQTHTHAANKPQANATTPNFSLSRNGSTTIASNNERNRNDRSRSATEEHNTDGRYPQRNQRDPQWGVRGVQRDTNASPLKALRLQEMRKCEGVPVYQPRVKALPSVAHEKGETVDKEKLETGNDQLAKDRFMLKLTDEEGRALSAKRFVLKLGGETIEGELNRQGELSVEIPEGATTGELAIWPYDDNDQAQVIPFEIAKESLPDVNTIAGVQARCNNLGFDAGVVDGINGSKTQSAVSAFQAAYQLEVDGVAGPKTKSKLTQVYKA